jgi:hypothetical protein
MASLAGAGRECGGRRCDVIGEIGEIETIKHRVRSFGEHVNGTTSEFVAVPRGDYDALWNHVEMVEGERDALANRLATLAREGIVVGEDGAPRWHGLTGREIERLKTACRDAFGIILRSDWKGRDARRAVMLLESALAAAAGRGAEGEVSE